MLPLSPTCFKSVGGPSNSDRVFFFFHLGTYPFRRGGGIFWSGSFVLLYKRVLDVVAGVERMTLVVVNAHAVLVDSKSKSVDETSRTRALNRNMIMLIKVQNETRIGAAKTIKTVSTKDTRSRIDG